MRPAPVLGVPPPPLRLDLRWLLAMTPTLRATTPEAAYPGRRWNHNYEEEEDDVVVALSGIENSMTTPISARNRSAPRSHRPPVHNARYRYPIETDDARCSEAGAPPETTYPR